MPEVLGPNLLTDPGIEVWTGNTADNWNEVNGASTVDETVDIHGGSHALELTPVSGESTGNFANSGGWNIPLEANTTYKFGGWGKVVSNLEGGWRFGVSTWPSIGWKWSETKTNTSSYEEAVGYFVTGSTPTNAKLFFYSLNNLKTSPTQVTLSDDFYFNKVIQADTLLKLYFTSNHNQSTITTTSSKPSIYITSSVPSITFKSWKERT